jgi:hypothetical protein
MLSDNYISPSPLIEIDPGALIEGDPGLDHGS